MVCEGGAHSPAPRAHGGRQDSEAGVLRCEVGPRRLSPGAACHGPDGKGEGTIAAYLNTALPDLTQLQVANNGVFPVSKVYGIIEGGPDIGPHGTQDMPAWGQRYVTRAEGDMDFIDNSESYAKFRILALIEYLSKISLLF